MLVLSFHLAPRFKHCYVTCPKILTSLCRLIAPGVPTLHHQAFVLGSLPLIGSFYPGFLENRDLLASWKRLI